MATRNHPWKTSDFGLSYESRSWHHRIQRRVSCELTVSSSASSRSGSRGGFNQVTLSMSAEENLSA
jgi:hypothetical protein